MTNSRINRYCRGVMGLFVVLMMGCSSRSPLTEAFREMPPFLQEEFLITKIENDVVSKEMLYIIHTEDNFSFVMLDLLGAPLSSKTLYKGEFKSNKLLPRNAFDEILFLNALFLLQHNQHSCYKQIKDTLLTLTYLKASSQKNTVCPIE